MAGTIPRTPSDPTGDEYWHETRRPLTCLLFLAPLLILYELGVIWIGVEPADVRNRADFWMRSGLEIAGLEHTLILPAAVVAILVLWQVYGRYTWTVRPSSLPGMLAESVLFAFGLVLVGELHGRLAGGEAASVPSPLAISRETAALAVTFLGAGLYEEVLFRLMLLPLLYAALRLARLTPAWAGGLAVLLSGVAFAAAHHIEFPHEAVPAAVFVFRAAAGVFFAGLFYWRGFGIAVGTHATYDLLVGIVLANHPV
jgi:hypothetical protein